VLAPVEVVARPFAAFFAEAFDDLRKARRQLDLAQRPAVPLNDAEPAGLPRGLCVECLCPTDECACE
jgi:hypothetical protein